MIQKYRTSGKLDSLPQQEPAVEIIGTWLLSLSSWPWTKYLKSFTKYIFLCLFLQDVSNFFSEVILKVVEWFRIISMISVISIYKPGTDLFDFVSFASYLTRRWSRRSLPCIARRSDVWEAMGFILPEAHIEMDGWKTILSFWGTAYVLWPLAVSFGVMI